MISTCQPVFKQCQDNYDVEKVLRDAKVIRPPNRTDTELCALVVIFKTQKEGHDFIDRLNRFLEDAA